MRSTPGQRSVASAQQPRTQEQKEEKKGRGQAPSLSSRTTIPQPSSSELVVHTDVEEVGVAHFFRASMAVEIVTPSETMGEVLGDLNVRRGHVQEMISQPPSQIIRARVPLAELFGYATSVRSLTKGRANYTMEPISFEVVPDNLQGKLLNR